MGSQNYCMLSPETAIPNQRFRVECTRPYQPVAASAATFDDLQYDADGLNLVVESYGISLRPFIGNAHRYRHGQAENDRGDRVLPCNRACYGFSRTTATQLDHYHYIICRWSQKYNQDDQVERATDF
jgi:hypothetical protein